MLPRKPTIPKAEPLNTFVADAPVAPKEHTEPQLRLTLPELDIEPVKMVSLKIPLSLYADIDALRRETGITLTDIFVKCATPEVELLKEQLERRKAARVTT